MFTLGIDIGASKVSAALVKNGGVVRFKKAEYGNRDAKSIEGKVLRLIDSVLGGAKVSGIGMGVPCPFDKAGKPVKCSNIPLLAPLRLSKILAAKYRLPVFLENDVKASALAEIKYGLGREIKNFVLAAFGTGIGGAIIIDGKLYKGGLGWAGEFGHTIVQIVKRKAQIIPIKWEKTASAQFLRAGGGKSAWAENAALGLLNITYALAPEYIVIGGGLLSLWDKKFNKKVIAAMRRLNPISGLPLPKILRAKTGERGGAIGAALLPTIYRR